jgi:hypothetical protein
LGGLDDACLVLGPIYAALRSAVDVFEELYDAVA